MKLLYVHKQLLTFVFFLILIAGCKQPETIVVNETPQTVAKDTTSDEAQTNPATFRRLVMGEYYSIPTLDPLFADNTAAMRAVQLVYEGLVRLDANGSVIPGMATSWNLSADSTEYTFTLRSDVYYQDSDVFSTGTGRKVVAQDVKFAFERMAKAGVPPRAAQLFMNIRGFDSYFQEQREVYLPQNRQLREVSGIKTPDQSTVVIQLVQPDEDFLKKLATPLAVIYPKEAVGNTAESFTAVGSGPFTLSSSSKDSSLIFSKFQNYYGASDVHLNRIDVYIGSSEKALFGSMSRGDIHLLPQLGPQSLKSTISANGSLADGYQDRYDIQITEGTTEFSLRYNPNANLSGKGAQVISNLVTADTDSFTRNFPANLVTASTSGNNSQTASASSIDSPIYSVYSEDPYVRTFLGHLSDLLEPSQIELQMVNHRAPSRNTGLLFSQDLPLIPDAQWQTFNSLARFQVKQVGLFRSEISGLNFNQYPWWFNPRGVRIPADENLN